jgi:hypothetical protein
MMQTDVLSAHLNASGQMTVGRTRLRGIQSVASSTAGTVNVWDTTTAPVSVTYGRSGTTVTITHNSHGLSTGNWIGLTFAAGTGGTATNGNYQVTVLTANTYTVTDINSGSITAGAAGTEGTRWLTSFDTAALTTSGVPQTMFFTLPGEGMLVLNGIYAQLSNQTGFTVFYG